MHNYSSDITRETFEIIRGKLEQAKKRFVQYFLRDTIFDKKRMPMADAAD